MMEIDLFRRHAADVSALYPALAPRRLILETVRRMINELIVDVTETTRANIARAGVASIADVRAAPRLVAFSEPIYAEATVLKRFLRKELYYHYRVQRMAVKAKRIVAELFQVFDHNPDLLPTEYSERHRLQGARVIADYVAGMTDRYAIREHRQLFDIEK
jgi:dGTPase